MQLTKESRLIKIVHNIQKLRKQFGSNPTQ